MIGSQPGLMTDIEAATRFGNHSRQYSRVIDARGSGSRLRACAYAGAAYHQRRQWLAPAQLGAGYRIQSRRKELRDFRPGPYRQRRGQTNGGFRCESDRLGAHPYSRAAPQRMRDSSARELFQSSDILSVHLRYSALSDNFVNATRLALMKPTALLVDISRAGVVNRQDLADTLKAQ
jgi:hypothetical protein